MRADDAWEFEREKTYGSGYGTASVRCPYFRNHGKREIHCDSPYGPDAVCILRFRMAEMKDRHLKTWCMGCFEKCEWFALMDAQEDPDD